MRISEMIDELQKVWNEHGDLFVENEDGVKAALEVVNPTERGEADYSGYVVRVY